MPWYPIQLNGYVHGAAFVDALQRLIRHLPCTVAHCSRVVQHSRNILFSMADGVETVRLQAPTADSLLQAPLQVLAPTIERRHSALFLYNAEQPDEPPREFAIARRFHFDFAAAAHVVLDDDRLKTLNEPFAEQMVFRPAQLAWTTAPLAALEDRCARRVVARFRADALAEPGGVGAAAQVGRRFAAFLRARAQVTGAEPVAA